MRQSQSNRLDRCVKACAPKPQVRFIWVDHNGPSFEQQRDAMIAAGEARATDEFVPLSWLAPEPEKGR